MNLIKRTFTDKEFLRSASSIAVPVALQQVLSTVTNMLDTLMIGSMGAAAISAVGLANQYYYVIALLIFGVHSGTGLLMSQFFGTKDYLHIRKAFGLGLAINFITASLAALAAFLAPAAIMGIFTNSPASTGLGTEYLQIVCISYPIYAFTSIMNSGLRSTRQVRIPLISSIISILVNVFMNYCLIFGHFGFPEMGVRGAAVATVIARTVECLVLAYFCFIKNEVIRGKISDFFGWSKGFLLNFLKHSAPVILNELTWGLGITIYYTAYGRMGDDAVAAVTISETITDMVGVFGSGLYTASSVLLGNELGAGHKDKALDYSRKLLVSGIAVAFFCMGLLFAFMKPALSLFSVSEEVLADASRCIYVFICYMPFLFTFGIIVVGVLRAGGDTIACFLIDTSSVWLIGIPMAFLGALVWKLPVWVTYALVNSEYVVKAFVCLGRYKKMIWLRNITDET